MSDKVQLIKEEIERLKDKGKYSDIYDYAFRDGNNNALDAIARFIDSLPEEPASEDLENQYRLNKRFDEGEKIYEVWYNSQLAKFLVIDRFYRENYDKYNIMLCASYEEATAFAFCMNKALLLPIKERKITLNHLEELKKQD